MPNNAALRPALVTSEVWVYHVVHAGTQTVISQKFGNGAGPTWSLSTFQGYPRLTSLHQNAGGVQFIQAPQQLPLFEWSHLAFTFDGSTEILYVNGVAVAQRTGLGPLIYDPDSSAFGIGAEPSADSPFGFAYDRVG